MVEWLFLMKGRSSFKLHVLQKVCINTWVELLISTISYLLAAAAQARHSSKLDVAVYLS